MASRREKLETLDRILAGGPLPWPSADEFDTLLMHHFDNQIRSFRWHACDLAIADAALAVKSGSSIFPAVMRLAAIDRRFNLESDAGIFLQNPASTLDLLGELVGEPGIGLFDPAQVSASDAAAYLERFPEPILDSLERRRSMLRRKFKSDRAIRADPDKGWEYFYLEEWRTRGIIPTVRGGADEGIFALIAEIAHYNELALIYRWKKQDYIQSVLDHQKRIDEAIMSGKEKIASMIEEANKAMRDGTYDYVTRDSEYLGLANDTLRISDYNHQRLMLHAVMTARAAGEDSERAPRDLQEFSTRWGNRADIEQTSAGLQISIGKQRVVIPSKSIRTE